MKYTGLFNKFIICKSCIYKVYNPITNKVYCRMQVKPKRHKVKGGTCIFYEYGNTICRSNC